MVRLEALRDIECGEELTMSYIDESETLRSARPRWRRTASRAGATSASGRAPTEATTTRTSTDVFLF